MIPRWKSALAIIFITILCNNTMGKFIQAGGKIEECKDCVENKDLRVKKDLSEKNHPSEGKLVFAHVIYRHGDRTPIDPYPTDPWNKLEYWPTDWGQLTNTGKLQHYLHGQWLRKRYSNLIKKTYDVNDVYIQSSDVDRTLMSAAANTAGLYPPANGEIWTKDMKWQPIPIHTIPLKMDGVLAVAKPCKAYDYYESVLESSPEIQQIYEKYSDLFQYITEHSGETIETFEQIAWINNTLYIESLYKKELPEWTKKIYPSEAMTYLSGLSFKMETYTRQMARLKGGPIVKEMLDRFTEKASGKLKPDRSLWIYSGHDTTVANVLGTLNLFKIHSPDYFSTVLLEMRINNGEPYISIFYKNNTVEEIEPMYIPGCGTSCPLKEMYKLYEDILPVDWEKECALSTLMMTYEEANIGKATGILVCILLSSLVGSYLLLIYCRRRHYRSQWNYSSVA